jgi:general secretion pathway protein G
MRRTRRISTVKAAVLAGLAAAALCLALPAGVGRGAPGAAASKPAAAKTQPSSGPADSQPASRPAGGGAIFGLGRAPQARIAAARTDIANLSTALDMFQVDCGRYPTMAEGLQALLAPPPGLKGWGGPYLKNLPNDPWGNAYLYACPGARNVKGFDLSSLGPDGKEGSGDDIGN